jgi:hypothetical protein
MLGSVERDNYRSRLQSLALSISPQKPTIACTPQPSTAIFSAVLQL